MPQVWPDTGRFPTPIVRRYPVAPRPGTVLVATSAAVWVRTRVDRLLDKRGTGLPAIKADDLDPRPVFQLLGAAIPLTLT
jgi:hypothetical protein